MNMFFLFLGFFSFLGTFLAALFALRAFRRLKLLDRPERFGYTRAPIPYGTGVMFFFVFALILSIFFPIDRKLLGVVLAGLLLSVTSFLDDFLNLSAFVRLPIHVIAGGILVFFGVSITVIRNPFDGATGLFVLTPLLSIFITILWIVLFTNTMNWLDGVPGVVSSISAVASLVLFVLAIRPNFHTIDQTIVASLAIIVFGMSLAFLFFDLSPPKMLMGDAGSIFLGFLIATLAIFSGGKLATAFLVLGVPILDALWSILRRIREGRVPWQGDFRHLHHRFLSLGFSARQVVLFYVAISALFGGIALLSGTIAKLIAGFALLTILFALALFLAFKTPSISTGQRAEKSRAQHQQK